MGWGSACPPIAQAQPRKLKDREGRLDAVSNLPSRAALFRSNRCSAGLALLTGHVLQNSVGMCVRDKPPAVRHVCHAPEHPW